MEIGAKRLRHIDTPHVPHELEARVIFEEHEHTLLRRSLHQAWRWPAITETASGGPAMEAEGLFRYSSLAHDSHCRDAKPGTWNQATLALMHGSSFRERAGWLSTTWRGPARRSTRTDG